jgi:hypothetical protein
MDATEKKGRERERAVCTDDQRKKQENLKGSMKPISKRKIKS